MDLSLSEKTVLKKVDLIYSKCECKLVIISTNKSLSFNEIESIKIEKATITFMKKLKYWLFLLFDNNIYPNKARRLKLNYRFAKSVTINLLNGKIIRSYHTAFDLITTSKIIKKINNEINTPFKYRV